jgi:hypothetical protein
MPSYFVDPVNGSDSNSGTNELAAFATMQKAMNVSVAGDTTYLRHLDTTDETITDPLVTAASGSSSGGEIRYIGVGADWSIDGSKYAIAGSTSLTSLLAPVHSYQKFKNLDLTGGASCIKGGGSAVYDFHFDNIHVSGASGFGIDSYALNRSLYTNCLVEDNGSYGIRSSNIDGIISLCTIRNNATGGFYGYVNSSYGCTVRDCLFIGNETYGIHQAYGWVVASNNVIDGQPYGIYMGSNATRQSFIVANRFTNYSTRAVTLNAVYRVYPLFSYNYFQQIDGLPVSNDQMNVLLTHTGLDTNQYGTSDGYVDRANGDFNLTADATMRRVAITLPS